MVIEYLVSPSLFEVIKIPFSQYEDFDNLPSQLYFMMILDACNTSAEIDIEGAEKAFNNLSLIDFTGDKIYDIDTTDIRNIKVMRSEYSLSPKLGMTIILKV